MERMRRKEKAAGVCVCVRALLQRKREEEEEEERGVRRGWCAEIERTTASEGPHSFSPLSKTSLFLNGRVVRIVSNSCMKHIRTQHHTSYGALRP